MLDNTASGVYTRYGQKPKNYTNTFKGAKNDN